VVPQPPHEGAGCLPVAVLRPASLVPGHRRRLLPDPSGARAALRAAARRIAGVRRRAAVGARRPRRPSVVRLPCQPREPGERTSTGGGSTQSPLLGPTG
jgi:hypothetical protein